MSLKNAARKTSRGWKTPPMWIMVKRVVNVLRSVGLVVFSMMQEKYGYNYRVSSLKI